MNTIKEIRIIWEYSVRTEYLSEFLKAYAPDGKWAKLFKKYGDYIKTDLHQDVDNPNRFITIDHWKLDNQCEAYFVQEVHIGNFQAK